VKIHRTFRRTPHGEQGYILITLMLFVMLIAIAAAMVLPELSFQVKRDREEEMIHRGVQYSRAIRRYYKKFGRYPTRIEELENTNNVRFLRRKYKDPITGKDFKLLHYGEVPIGMGGLGMAAGLAAAGGLNGMGGRPGAGGVATSAAQMQAGMAMAGMAAVIGAAAQNNNSDQSGSTDSSSGSGKNGGASGSQPSTSSSGTGQVIGGGPVIGVVSLSKDQTVREFASKNHYNQWNFVYDPSMDRGGLITGPAQPLVQGFGQNGQMQGVPGAQGTQGQNGAGQSGFGQNSFGQPGNQPQPAQPQTPQEQQ